MNAGITDTAIKDPEKTFDEQRGDPMNETENKIYESICRHDGIKAKDIAKETGINKTDINRLLYCTPFIKELCFRDDDYLWYGLIRQQHPHAGLSDFCGYYDTVGRFLSISEDEWLEELTKGCMAIGRNLNDTRGLFHSFRDSRQTMLGLFSDLEKLSGQDSENIKTWEICFELRIKRAKWIRIYADVLVITENKVFSLEFKMKDKIDPEEELQAVKYAKYLDVIFGSDYEVIPALVLTGATDIYRWEPLPGSTAEVPVCSGDMLFNLFDEFIGFLE